MAHFGILSFKGTGHLNPLITLSKELMARGHSVSFVQRPEVETRIRAHGIGFCVVGRDNAVQSTTVKKRATKPSGGIAAIRYSLERISAEMEMYLRDGPEAIRSAGVDVLIVDEVAFAGPTLAEMLQLPYFIISTSIPHHLGWSDSSIKIRHRSWTETLYSLLLEVSVQRMYGPVRHALDVLRKRHGLGSSRDRTYLELAHITPLPECLDLPHKRLSGTFHYTGPFVDEEARTPMEFPWEQLDGRRLVYASLGTTLKGEPDTFRMIAEACAGLNLQLVITLGDRRDPAMFQNLQGSPIVVKVAPQLELLKKVSVVITHAGPNTAFETLLHGIPMVAIPKAFDQPGIAKRLRLAGVAEVLSLHQLTAQRIRAALLKVLDEPRYRVAAQKMQRDIAAIRGLNLAADIIENSLHHFRQRAELLRKYWELSYSNDPSMTAE
ncbi:MGT family glycosyltransferase [Granulicella sp. 5B5]|uniref:glycosyltransferase n=1 Tax=Granulicella sp. 5B5 TaxID=1617967 RepID=UPI0015F3611B|nr:glycosyltransferase [Granulicella sp. 5B5]QMV20008.1 MGT family glycosyltransferase [Granulicella sp. 5B5]